MEIKNCNIVELIENNPITKLSNDYNIKLLVKIKEQFTEFEQQLFLSSFYCYFKYHPTNDYVIDLDDIWKWLGFTQKIKAKKLLEKFFVIDKDYKKSMCDIVKQTNHTKGGHNKEMDVFYRIRDILKKYFDTFMTQYNLSWWKPPARAEHGIP
jgi:hypothetical protein